MEELKNMVNEVVHYVKYSYAKKISIVEEAVAADSNADGSAKTKTRKKSSTKSESETGGDKAIKDKKDKKDKTAHDSDIELICPKCGRGLVKKGKTVWGCNLYGKSCDFLIPMEIMNKKLTQKQVNDLILKSKTSKLSGFVSEDGEKLSGILKFDENKKIVFVR